MSQQAMTYREPPSIASQKSERTTTNSKPQLIENHDPEQARLGREPCGKASQLHKRTTADSKPEVAENQTKKQAI